MAGKSAGLDCHEKELVTMYNGLFNINSNNYLGSRIEAHVLMPFLLSTKVLWQKVER